MVKKKQIITPSEQKKQNHAHSYTRSRESKSFLSIGPPARVPLVHMSEPMQTVSSAVSCSREQTMKAISVSFA